MTCSRIREAEQKLQAAQLASNQTEAQRIHFEIMDHEMWHELGSSIECRAIHERIYDMLYR